MFAGIYFCDLKMVANLAKIRPVQTLKNLQYILQWFILLVWLRYLAIKVNNLNNDKGNQNIMLIAGRKDAHVSDVRVVNLQTRVVVM